MRQSGNNTHQFREKLSKQLCREIRAPYTYRTQDISAGMCISAWLCALQVLILDLCRLQPLPLHLDADPELCRAFRKPRHSPGLVAVSSLGFSLTSGIIPVVFRPSQTTLNLMPVASFLWKERHPKEAKMHNFPRPISIIYVLVFIIIKS